MGQTLRTKTSTHSPPHFPLNNIPIMTDQQQTKWPDCGVPSSPTLHEHALLDGFPLPSSPPRRSADDHFPLKQHHRAFAGTTVTPQNTVPHLSAIPIINTYAGRQGPHRQARLSVTLPCPARCHIVHHQMPSARLCFTMLRTDQNIERCKCVRGMRKESHPPTVRPTAPSDPIRSIRAGWALRLPFPQCAADHRRRAPRGEVPSGHAPVGMLQPSAGGMAYSFETPSEPAMDQEQQAGGCSRISTPPMRWWGWDTSSEREELPNRNWTGHGLS